MQALLYSVSVYFLAGLTMGNNGLVFLDYLFQMFLVAYFGSSIFFFLSAVASIPEVANALAGNNFFYLRITKFGYPDLIPVSYIKTNTNNQSDILYWTATYMQAL